MGASDAASVGGRGAVRHHRRGVRTGAATISGSFRELGEVWFPFLHVRVAALLRLFAHVVEKRRVARELLDACETVIGRIEAGLEHAERERAELEDPPAPGNRLLFERREGHDLVYEAHVQSLLGVVLLAQEPDLARLFLADDAGEKSCAVAAIEAAHPWAGLAEPSVIGGERQGAHRLGHDSSTR